MQVERKQVQQCMLSSGARVRNTYATYPLLGNNPEKLGLIPHGIIPGHPGIIKDLLVRDGHAPH
jgi:hypothetical protein